MRFSLSFGSSKGLAFLRLLQKVQQPKFIKVQQSEFFDSDKVQQPATAMGKRQTRSATKQQASSARTRTRAAKPPRRMQQNRKYKMDELNQKQRARKKIATTRTPRAVKAENLMAKLEGLYGSGTLEERTELYRFISSHIKGIVSIEGAQVRKAHGSKGKPVGTAIKHYAPSKYNNKKGSGINKKHKNNLLVGGTMMVDLNDNSQKYECIVRYVDEDLFVIKRSTLDNARLGLFAAKPYKKGEMLGFYGGKVLDKSRPPSAYAVRLRTRPSVLVDPSAADLWMGLHFANDPNYAKYHDNQPVDPDDKCYNVQVDGKLKATAKRNIKKNQELFWCYNLASGMRTGSQDEQDESSDGNDDEESEKSDDEGDEDEDSDSDSDDEEDDEGNNNEKDQDLHDEDEDDDEEEESD